MFNTKIIFYISLVISMVFWGASWVHAKVLSDYITAQELIFYRYTLTTISLMPIMLYMKLSFKISMKNILIALISSVFLVLYSIFFFNGTKYGTAGLGGAFVTTLTPILTFVLLVLFFKKEFSKKDILALLIGAIGVLTILNIWTFTLNEIFVIANLYFLLASVSWSGLTISNAKSDKINPIVLTFYIYIMTTIMGYIISDFPSGNIFEFDNIFWINLISVSILGTTIATSIYFTAITKLGTGEASSFIFLVPFNAIFLSYIFLDEPIYYTTIIGTILTILAVSMINKIKFPTFTKKYFKDES